MAMPSPHYFQQQHQVILGVNIVIAHWTSEGRCGNKGNNPHSLLLIPWKGQLL